MKKLKRFLYCFLFIALSACVKDADVKIPEVETKLVLSSFISPQDELIKVSVSSTVPIYNNPEAHKKHEPITNATVVISSGTDSWTLPYNLQYKRYVLDSSHIHIRAGLNYSLSVSTPEGKFAEAVTFIPYSNNTFTYTIAPDPELANEYTLHAQWQDPSSSTDYYLIETLNILHNTSTSTSRYTRFERASDEGNSGQLLKKSIDFSYYASRNDTVYAAVSVITPELYKYYGRLKNTDISSDDIFSEPYPMYTNIKGGVGIFSGFNRHQVRVFP